MKYVFPFIVVFDKESETYVFKFKDMPIIAESDTVEEAYLSALEYLRVYCSANLKINGFVDTPSKYDDMKKYLDKGAIVLLADYTANETAVNDEFETI